MFSRIRMWGRKLERMLGCAWGRQHQWFEYRDMDHMYSMTSIPIVRRTCQHCGTAQVAVYQENTQVWISAKRADQVMKGL